MKNLEVVPALSSTQRMKVSLRYLVYAIFTFIDPGYQKGIGQELGVDQATVSRTVRSEVDRILHKQTIGLSFLHPTKK